MHHDPSLRKEVNGDSQERSMSDWMRDARELLAKISMRRSEDFTGVGVVFYRELSALPHLQLTSEAADPNPTRFEGVDIADALASISTSSCALHDGFHFVDVTAWKLTHLSQFISPPIPAAAARTFRGTGARLMAASLTAVLPGICCVGLVSQSGEVHMLGKAVKSLGEA